MIALLSAVVFLGAAGLDYATARYFAAVAARQPHHAGMWSVAMYLVGSLGYLSVVEVSAWLMLPQCLGLYAGTQLAVRRAGPGT